MSGKRKFTVPGVIAILAALGVGYWYRQSWQPRLTTSGVSASLLKRAEAIPSILPPASAGTTAGASSWDEVVRRVSKSSYSPGLLQAANAFRDIKPGEAPPGINDVLNTGWSKATPEITKFVKDRAGVLQNAFQSVENGPITMPTLAETNSMVPNFLAAQSTFKLMLLRAREMQAGGDAAGAAMACVSTMRLAQSFSSRQQPLISHLIAVAGESMGAKVLASILNTATLSAADARKVGEALMQVHERTLPTSEIIAGEGACSVLHMRQLRAKGGADPQSKLARSIPSMEQFEKQWDTYCRILMAYFEQPYWKRRDADMSALQFTIVGAQAQPNYAEAATRTEVALAHIRLCILLADLRASNDAQTTSNSTAQRDPFVDDRLKVSKDRVWSLGPDSTDQGGQLLYDPTNGTVSPGDIALRR